MRQNQRMIRRMLAFFRLLVTFVANPFRSRRRVEIENLFLRHQLNIALRRAPHRLRPRTSDRTLLVLMTWLWPGLIGLSRVVQPDTILRWHRAGFRRAAGLSARRDRKNEVDPSMPCLGKRLFSIALKPQGDNVKRHSLRFVQHNQLRSAAPLSIRQTGDEFDPRGTVLKRPRACPTSCTRASICSFSEVHLSAF
jgi:hypothetical protein